MVGFRRFRHFILQALDLWSLDTSNTRNTTLYNCLYTLNTKLSTKNSHNILFPLYVRSEMCSLVLFITFFAHSRAFFMQIMVLEMRKMCIFAQNTYQKCDFSHVFRTWIHDRTYNSHITEGVADKVWPQASSAFRCPAEQFKEFRGALTENYVLQSLLPQFEAPLRYWTSGNQAELEFLIQQGNNIIPVDAKAGRSIISKSMTEYTKSYSPALRLRYSMLNLVHDGTVLNIPLFLADRTRDFIHFALDS